MLWEKTEIGRGAYGPNSFVRSEEYLLLDNREVLKIWRTAPRFWLLQPPPGKEKILEF